MLELVILRYRDQCGRFAGAPRLGEGGSVERLETSLASDRPVGTALYCAYDRGASNRWYALYVRSRHEKVVEGGLRGKGYIAFSPFYRTKRKRVDRIVEVDVPLFPGYVFCHFNVNNRLPILMTPGIVGLVGTTNRPGAVDETEIASIRTLSLSGRPVQPWPFLKSGQRVRLQAGPLAGAEGIFLRVKDACHLVVSVTLLQRSVSVTIETESVEPLT